MEYYSARKKGNFESFVGKWSPLETMMLTETHSLNTLWLHVHEELTM